MAGSESRYVRPFAELSLADRAAVGGKSASLGELIRAGVQVPPGFVVSTAAFSEFLADTDPAGEIRQEIEKLVAADSSAIAAACERIRQHLRESPVPTNVAESIVARFRLQWSSDEFAVAVRSSATCEDSAQASFAGLQDTYLWVLGESDLLERVRSCWASLYNDESVAYRLRLDIPESDVSMAVVIQQMVDADCAGVMFTRSPTTGDKSVVVIEGSWGLGSCIVNGEVTPDRFVINKVTGEINSRNVSEKSALHEPDRTNGGIVALQVDADRRTVSCLTDDDIGELWQIARKLERHYGCPQDIEWAIPRERASAGASVYLLQSRPETVWAKRDKKPKARPAAKSHDHVVSLLSAGKKRS